MPEKVCQICGQNCADRPRVRDARGRYACKACLEQRRARTPGAAPPISPSAAGPPTEPLDEDAALLAELAADMPRELSRPCPACGNPLDTDATLCTTCGYAGGVKLQTKVIKERPVKARKPKLDAHTANMNALAVHRQGLAWCLGCIGIGILVFMVMMFSQGDALIDAESGRVARDMTYQGAFLLIRVVLALVAIVASIFAILCMVSMRWNVVLVIFLGLLSFVPCIGLITLLVVYSRAGLALRMS